MPPMRKVVLISLALALLLGGCGGDSSSTEATASLKPFRITNRFPTVREESKMHLSANGLSGPEPKPIMPKAPPPEFLAMVDLSEGIGVPREGGAMTVQYVGYDYETGKKLVSSWDEGKPLTFTRGKGEVIQGWEEALVGMEGGDRREVVVPPDLAKGSKPPGIPPGKTVVFVVEPVPLKSGWKPLAAKSLGKTKPKVEIPKGSLPKNVVKIKDLKEGKGPVAEGGDEVTVDYVGVLYKNGKQFEASWDRGESLTFQLGRSVAIQGWEQGLAGMKVGGRRELIVPPKLGYGPQGAASIPPNSALVYVIDLTAIN
jgi:FKBP-type peptidyl-prolyl cis-trans isomerase